MKEFQYYAHFYDLLYADKAYKAETRYVHGLLQQHGTDIHRLLDVGCGTGLHAVEFLELGYQVTGLDRSPEMLALAEKRKAKLPGHQNRNFELVESSLQAYRSAKRFDAITALFHVMSYQATGDQLERAIEAAADNLVANGLFVFDFWHAPAVLKEPPSIRTRQVKDQVIAATRTSNPHHEPERRQVRVDFVLDIEELGTGTRKRIKESHLMRYFDVPELITALESGGFSCVVAHKWMGTSPPGENDWYACIVARKD